MEATRDKFGRPMERERDGHTGGGQLFVGRRAVDFEAGFLTEKGHNSNYLAFRPSNLFMRVLGDDVLGLNEALFTFRDRAVDLLLVVDDDGVQAHYGELNRRFEVVRDRLQALTDYCNKGFDRQLDEALELALKWVDREAETAGDGDAGDEGFRSARPRRVRSRQAAQCGRGGAYGTGQRAGLRGLQVVSVLRACGGRDRLHFQRRAAAGGGPHAAVHPGRPWSRRCGGTTRT